MDSEINEKLSADDTKNILKFLTVIGRLKHLRRTGWVKNNIEDCESVAGHMYRMGIMCLLLGKGRNSALNQERCMKISLIHDMAECIVGDITPHCGVTKEEKKKREESAMKEICSLLHENTRSEIKGLFQEYEDQVTPEAKIVKDLDRFDMILQAYEYEKVSNNNMFLQEFFDHTDGCFMNEEVIGWVEELKKLRISEAENSSQGLKNSNCD